MNREHPSAIVFNSEDTEKATIDFQPQRHTKSLVQTKFRASNQFLPWGVRQIKAPPAWLHSTGQKIKVAVIDTGIDDRHPDLRRNIAGGINIIHRHLPPRDDNGHGTHISGTIAASSQKKGIIGVAPAASLFAVKAFDHNGTAYISDIVMGIEWCIHNRINIINMSFGMKNYSKALEDVVRKAYEAGVVIVASSGNDGHTGKFDYPAKFTNTICVGATTKNKTVASFSNRGKYIDIYAPGDKIHSTWLNGKYHELSGTSMAASHISGVLAMMMAVRGPMSIKTIKLLLKKSATTIKGRKSIIRNTGEVNAQLAVRLAQY